MIRGTPRLHKLATISSPVPAALRVFTALKEGDWIAYVIGRKGGNASYRERTRAVPGVNPDSAPRICAYQPPGEEVGNVEAVLRE